MKILPRPAGSTVHIPGAWKQTGYRTSPSNRFEHEPVYTDGQSVLAESDLLAAGVACYRVQIDRFTVRDYPAVMPVVLIRAECTALGLSIEASKDEGATWQFVQLTPYKERDAAPSVLAYRKCIDPAQDRADYFAELDRRGIIYKRAQV